MDNASSKGTSTKLAEDRTDWAEDRTILANERTFAAWMRTGMACVAIAIGLKAVFGDFEPTWAAKAVASIFLVASIFIFWSARREAMKTLSRLSQTVANAQPTRAFTLLASILTLGTVAVGGILWSL